MHFPLFIDLTDRLVVVIGAGTIATRRVLTLLKFNCQIKLIAPNISGELQNLVADKLIEYLPVSYDKQFLTGAFMVVAATNERRVNHQVYQDATAHHLLVNIADNKQECSFYFPAIVENEQIVGGLISKAGHNHALVKHTAKQIRNTLNGGN